MENDVNLRNNSEISDALKEFHVNNIIQQAKSPVASREIKASPMVRFVIKHSLGLVKDERQANYVLFVVAIAVFTLSGYLFFTSVKSDKPTNVKNPNINQINKRVPSQINR